MDELVRRVRAIAVVVVVSLLALSARAQDGGSREGGSSDAAGAPDGTVPLDAGAGDGPNCDSIPLGACQRTINVYCDSSGTIVRYNCAQLTRDGGIPVGCGLVDCADTDCYGYACISPSGGFCDGQSVYCEEGAGLGCSAIPWVGATGGTCQAAEACDPSTFIENCTGDLLSWCPLTRVWSFSCSGGGVQPYVCGDGSSGKTCLGTAGGACNLVAVPPYECAPGYQCNSQDGSGLCAPAPDSGIPHDAAAADGATGDSSTARPAASDESAGACACRGAAGRVPAIAAALALLGLGRWRRYR